MSIFSSPMRPLLVMLALFSLAACTLSPPATQGGGDAMVTAGDGTLVAGGDVPPPVSGGTPLELPGDEPLTPLPPPSNPAVVALLDSAHSETAAGRYPSATAAVERALRIEPRNPQLWQELAIIKLRKGEYPQAESFAARSNSWAAGNKPLMAKNWRIIAESRSLRGDNNGAKAALARARALEPAPTLP